ncbi:MAG TPA: retropepsin-like aspartic protease [Candidatus Eisenbacteria bacterium]|nr:retropepsin-like aspartic protease [Candidatus Eisenbacteria bacterium]
MRLAAVVVAAILTTSCALFDRASGKGEVPLRGDGTSWLVQVTVNDRASGLFLVDTGASYCVLAPAFARGLALPPTDKAVTLHTANGIVRAPVVRIATLDLGTTRAHDVQAIVHDAVGPKLDGVIGLNFLNQYRYAIDPQRRTLHLQ